MDEEIIILPIDICRICTNLQSNLDILTDKLEDEHVLLHEALEFVSCIRIDFDDGMSRTMCLTCSKRLSDAYTFKNQILDSYRAFYNQTSDFNFKNEDSIQENNSAITAVETNSMERANELGIKLSTDAVSFLLEHNNCKIRNKKEPLSIEENLIAEDESATVEQIQTEENEPPLIESNQVENNEAPSIEVETPTIEQVLSEENEFTVELKEMEENEHSIEVIQTEENEYTIKLIQVEENEPPSIENNQVDNTENPSIEGNQINNIEPLSIEKYNKSPPTPNSRIRKRNITSSDQKNSKCSQKKLPTKNNKTEKYKLSCHICHKILPKISNLKDHLRLHANEKNFVCSFCQKAFVQIANYRTHLRVHTKERPYHCHLCSKTYSQASSLKTHVRSHTNEKNHFCDVCYKGFTNSSDLKKHKIIHDVSRQFACETCGHLFSQKANLRVHERNIHLRLNK